jgi:hypothetical protein
MEAAELEFSEWWEEFLAAGHPREDFYDARDRLLRFVDDLLPAKREAFISELADLGCRQGKAWGLALAVLERLAGPDVRRRVAQAVETLPRVHPPHPLGDYRAHLLRVLAADPGEESLAAVDSYSQDEIGPGFTSVVWALWPHHEARFARYHARYFAEQPSDDWKWTFVVLAFLAKPRALEMVRDALIEAHPDAWINLRTALLAACARTPRWETEQDVNEVRRICGTA